MNKTIHANMRVLYKENGQWKIGTLQAGDALIDEKGLFLPIVDKESYVDFNDIFFDAIPVEDWHKKYSEYFMTKKEYIEYIQSDEFDKQIENAYVSDGEYAYYRVNKFNETWLMKQPFEYIVRYD